MDDTVQQKLENFPDFGGFQEKGRAFSTSTPLVHNKLSDSLPPRSLSTSAWSPNDSGYADSISSDDTCQVTPNASKESFTQFRLTNLDLSPSPPQISQKHSTLQTDKFVPRFSLGFHTLDYEIPEEELVFEKFSPNKSPIPHYSLEDEDMCSEETEASAAASQALDSELTKTFDAVLQQCMPKVPDRIIGRKMGLERMDVVSELNDRGMVVILEKIASYLQASDIRRMCRVSKKWTSICSRWTIQKQRRPRSLKRLDKENVRHKVPQELDTVRKCLTVGEQTTLCTIQAIQERVPPLSSIGTQKDLFVQTAQSLKNEEKMTKCPMCQQAAIVYPVQERGMCQSDKCQFDYCVKCFHPFHQSKPCESLTVPKRSKDSKIGGKHGKKFLRRL
ncbi:F-box only protein 43-like [Saccostrea echinata]|uniref:F-box only protein 43-like n=1 Tax=Saccostrea echinata TaxID=191078 RepID=UPI002A8411D6|nr:F-box only protein 43-like [Saccostrea echinata]